MRKLLLATMGILLGLTVGSAADAATPKTHHKTTHRKPVARRKKSAAVAHHAGSERGKISYFHPKLAGKKMANGEQFRPDSNAAASRTLPLGSKATVTNLANGRTETVEIKDRGPVSGGRIMDVSPATADKLGMKKNGAVSAEVTPIPRTEGKE
jgi:rare lipoprotein A